MFNSTSSKRHAVGAQHCVRNGVLEVVLGAFVFEICSWKTFTIQAIQAIHPAYINGCFNGGDELNLYGCTQTLN